MKVLFAGTPELAVPSLQALAAENLVAGVLTNPDRPLGRGRVLTPSPVAQAAADLNLATLKPEKLDAGARDQVAALGADLLVVFAYGRIFGPRFLGLFPMGGINLHPSLLPRHRGPTPIPAAILAGDTETGLTVQTLAAEVDSGDIVLQTRLLLTGDETCGSLSERVARESGALLVQAVRELAAGTAALKPQNHAEATWTPLIDKQDGLVDWSRPASHIERMIRAYKPWPLARTTFRGQGLSLLEAGLLPNSETVAEQTAPPGTLLRVDKNHGLLIQTGAGILCVRRLQFDSKKPVDHWSFANGNRDCAGALFGGT